MKLPLCVTLLIIIASGTAYGVQRQSVSQWGITFYFENNVEVGQYANGDYWVVGPVTITRITPDFDGHNNGWEVNPVVSGGHGFQDNCYGGGFDTSLVPTLPYAAKPGESIVKTTPSREVLIGGTYRPCIDTAAVLTVVASVPADNGSTVFRPPYSGVSKPSYSTGSLKTNLLPSLAPVTNSPALETVKGYYDRVQIDHKGGGIGRALRPRQNMPDYGGDMGRREAETALRLMLDDPVEEKMDALISFIQAGIDMHAIVKQGQFWGRGGGEQPCHTLPYVFAAVMLDDQEMKDKITEVATSEKLYNDYVLEHGNDGTVLFGDHENASEYGYWNSLANDSGSRTQADPYGYIDGGIIPGGYYQFCCTSMIWKGLALSFHLMPELKLVWNNQKIFDYVDRWVERGTHTQLDPCAPYDGNWSNYGITFGPDPEKPGECIQDTDPSDGLGRFPERHGLNVDDGNRQTVFQNTMWTVYRGSISKPIGFEIVRD